MPLENKQLLRKLSEEEKVLIESEFIRKYVTKRNKRQTSLENEELWTLRDLWSEGLESK